MVQGSDIIIEYTYNASIEEVWKAITDNNDMKKWYFDLPEFKAEVGFKFQFYGGSNEHNQYLHKCEVSEVISHKKLTYSWCYDGYEGKSFVTFELSKEGIGTRLKLTQTGIDTFPNKSRFVEGWTYILGTSLKRFIDQ